MVAKPVFLVFPNTRVYYFLLLILPTSILKFPGHNICSNSFNYFNNTVIIPTPQTWKQVERLRDTAVSFFAFSEHKKKILERAGEVVGIRSVHGGP